MKMSSIRRNEPSLKYTQKYATNSQAYFMQTPQNEQKTPVQASQDYSTRIFLFALELIPYFAIPAGIGFYINKRVVESNPDTSILITAMIFFAMYLFSWSIVVMRYKAIRRQHQK